MATTVWSNVAVAVQSAIAAGVTVTAISKASTGVVSTGTTPSQGDFVLINAQGMHQVDGRVFRVGTVVASTSFQLEGEDTTNYDTFTSGTYQVITFGTSVTSISGLTASGGEFEFADDTTIHVSQRSQIPTVATSLTYSMESLWDPADAAQIALKAASQAKSTRAVRISFSNGKKTVFNGYVGFTGVPTGTAQDKVICPLVFTVQRSITNYAT